MALNPALIERAKVKLAIDAIGGTPASFLEARHEMLRLGDTGRKLGEHWQAFIVRVGFKQGNVWHGSLLRWNHAEESHGEQDESERPQCIIPLA
jgi:hypothetical protein